MAPRTGLHATVLSGVQQSSHPVTATLRWHLRQSHLHWLSLQPPSEPVLHPRRDWPRFLVGIGGFLQTAGQPHTAAFLLKVPRGPPYTKENFPAAGLPATSPHLSPNLFPGYPSRPCQWRFWHNYVREGKHSLRHGWRKDWSDPIHSGQAASVVRLLLHLDRGRPGRAGQADRPLPILQCRNPSEYEPPCWECC